jgi:hypothetical protein
MAESPVSDAEEWRPVPGYPGYEASSLGRVRSLDRVIIDTWGRRYHLRGSILKPAMSNGYHLLRINTGSITVYRLVCPTFHGPRPSKSHQVAHNDGNPFNNKACNIRWATVAENHADKTQHGTALTGARNHMTKLSEADVREIRKQCQPSMPYGAVTALARRFGVSPASIHLIRSRANWKHVT